VSCQKTGVTSFDLLLTFAASCGIL